MQFTKQNKNIRSLMYTVRKNTLMKFQLNIELSQPAANLTVLKVTSLLLDYPNHIIRLKKQTNNHLLEI